MRDDFCAFILTHGRPDRVVTYDTLRKQGYTGKVYIVIDDEDDTEEEYRKRFGDKVLQFSKAEIAKTFDEGDNFNDRRAIIYARNACFQLAREVGCKYFIQLDDDYNVFEYRFGHDATFGHHKADPDWLFSKLVDFLEATPFQSVAMAQGGDFIGGGAGTYAKKIQGIRKAMNTFVCSVDRPFQFVGRINEDVNTYTCEQRRGMAFLTFVQASITQAVTQSNTGGMTDLYLDSGTYVKSFYSVMYCPSAVTVKTLNSKNARLHHSVNWRNVAPLIVREKHRKERHA